MKGNAEIAHFGRVTLVHQQVMFMMVATHAAILVTFASWNVDFTLLHARGI